MYPKIIDLCYQGGSAPLKYSTQRHYLRITSESTQHLRRAIPMHTDTRVKRTKPQNLKSATGEAAW